MRVPSVLHYPLGPTPILQSGPPHRSAASPTSIWLPKPHASMVYRLPYASRGHTFGSEGEDTQPKQNKAVPNFIDWPASPPPVPVAPLARGIKRCQIMQIPRRRSRNNHTTTQPHNHTTTQPHNDTTTQPHNHTTTQPHNHTTIPFNSAEVVRRSLCVQGHACECPASLQPGSGAAQGHVSTPLIPYTSSLQVSPHTQTTKNKATRSNHTRLTGWGRRGREAL